MLHAALAAMVCFSSVCVNTEVVSKQPEMGRGLSGRSALAPGKGMLFKFEDEDLHRFWMKDMKFNLDIIWMDKQGKVVFIAPDLQPCTPQACPSYGPPQKDLYVLEVNASFCKTNGIKPGSKATYTPPGSV